MKKDRQGEKFPETNFARMPNRIFGGIEEHDPDESTDFARRRARSGRGPVRRSLILEKEEARMVKAKKGDFLSCAVCGLVLVVDEACGCAVSKVICCAKPMAPGKMGAARVKKIAAVKKAPAKAVAKAPAKAPVKASAKALAKPKAQAKAKAKMVAKAKPAKAKK
jgi:hypothetical protein